MNNKKRCLYINGEEVMVTEEVYKEYMKPVWRESKQALRGWRCRLSNGRRCHDNCDECEFARLGEGPFGTVGSLDFLEEVEDPALLSEYDLEESTINKELISTIWDEVSKMDEVNQRLVDMLYKGYSQTEIGLALGISQPAVYKRIIAIRKNLKKFLR